MVSKSFCHWKSYTYFFFAYHDCLLTRSIYCSKRYADSIIKQHENAHFTEFKVTRLFLDGEIWTQPKYIFCKWLVRIVQPVYYTDQMQWCLDNFFRKRPPPKICEEENRTWRITTKKNCSFKHYRRLLHRGHMKKEITFHQQSKKAFNWLQFDSLTKQRFVAFMVNFPLLRNVIERKM